MRLGELLVDHAGVMPRAWLPDPARMARVRVNGSAFDAGMVPGAGDQVDLDGVSFVVVDGGGAGRLQVIGTDSEQRPIRGPVRVHCGYHKAMTEFSKTVYRKTCRAPWWPGASFRHFFHRLDAFYGFANRHSLCSVSGHVLDLDRFEDIRVVRVVRDPRDLLISGYHYHKRSAEHWCDLASPTDLDWMIVAGHVPDALPDDESLAGYLNRVSREAGLAAEYAFRQPHFENMRAWPDDPRVLTLRYEDILGNEAICFGRIAEFLTTPWLTGMGLRRHARRYRAAGRTGKRGHVRDARSEQWREQLGSELQDRLVRDYADVLDRYGYPRS